LPVKTDGQLTNAIGFRPLVVAYRNGRPIRLDEVANVFDGVENDKTASWYNDLRTIYLAINRQPGTNTVEIVDRIREVMPQLEAQMPASLTLAVRSDRSVSIRESVHDIKLTLMLTVALVVLVIFLFLRHISATIIPSLALPASIVGTFAAMYMLGYSLDNLSLMALTLSVGFVVDDAIVMLENIVRHMEHGEDAMTAALNGSKENRVHDRLDDAVARRRVHSGALHGRNHRAAAARVRGDDRRRDSGVWFRVDQPHADALGPVPHAAGQAAARADVSGQREGPSTARSARTAGRCGRR
jgi:Cu/Ag efflux pump CusA